MTKLTEKDIDIIKNMGPSSAELEHAARFFVNKINEKLHLFESIEDQIETMQALWKLVIPLDNDKFQDFLAERE